MRGSDKFSKAKHINFSTQRVAPSLSVNTSKRYPNKSGMRIGLPIAQSLTEDRCRVLRSQWEDRYLPRGDWENVKKGCRAAFGPSFRSNAVARCHRASWRVKSCLRVRYEHFSRAPRHLRWGDIGSGLPGHADLLLTPAIFGLPARRRPSAGGPVLETCRLTSRGPIPKDVASSRADHAHARDPFRCCSQARP